MRIGLIIYGDLRTISGGYIYDRMLVEYLRGRGDHVEVISLSLRNYPRHLSDNISRALRHRLWKASLDVLLEDELNHPSLFWTNRWLSDKISYPIISIVHHLRCSEYRPKWQNLLYQWVEKLYLQSVTAFIYNSNTTARVVETVIQAKRPGVIAYPAGDRLHVEIGPNEIIERAHRTGPLRIVFVGNVIPRKGVDVLISGLGLLPRDSWQLDVVGSLMVNPTYVRDIRRQIAQRGLTDRVRLSGLLPDTELISRLAASHVLAVPSSYEGYGIVYIEAMGFGLPILASNAGAIPELVTHGKEGFLISPGNADALAHYVDRLHRDRDQLVQVSRAALERYRRHPTWAESSERIRGFLHTFVR